MPSTNYIQHPVVKKAINETFLFDKKVEILNSLPKESSTFYGGLLWGTCEKLYTPAYWKFHYLLDSCDEDFTINSRVTNSIFSEIFAVLAVNFRNYSYTLSYIDEKIIEEIRGLQLCRNSDIDQCVIGELNKILYIYIERINYKNLSTLQFLLDNNELHQIPTDNACNLRHHLMRIKGLGWHSSSMIARNFLDIEHVAVIDKYIAGACRYMGLCYDNKLNQNNYQRIEQIFITSCKNLQVHPSKMGMIMQEHLRWVI